MPSSPTAPSAVSVEPAFVRYLAAVSVIAAILASPLRTGAQGKPPHTSTRPLAAQLNEAFPGDTRRILEHADSLSLLSLAPDRPTWENVTDRAGRHHQLPLKSVPGPDADILVLGEVVIKSRQQRRQIIGSLYDSIARATIGSACFEPHHAIRTIRKGKSIVIVICFGCGNAYVYSGKGSKEISGFMVARGNYAATFDKILRDNKVPIATKSGGT